MKLSLSRKANPTRGAKFSFSSSRAARGLPILPEKVELLGLKIEDGAAIIHDGGWKVQRVANAEVQCQPVAGLEVVLKEELGNLRARLQKLLLDVDREVLHLP